MGESVHELFCWLHAIGTFQHLCNLIGVSIHLEVQLVWNALGPECLQKEEKKQSAIKEALEQHCTKETPGKEVEQQRSFVPLLDRKQWLWCFWNGCTAIWSIHARIQYIAATTGGFHSGDGRYHGIRSKFFNCRSLWEAVR